MGQHSVPVSIPEQAVLNDFQCQAGSFAPTLASSSSLSMRFSECSLTHGVGRYGQLNRIENPRNGFLSMPGGDYLNLCTKTHLHSKQRMLD